MQKWTGYYHDSDTGILKRSAPTMHSVLWLMDNRPDLTKTVYDDNAKLVRVYNDGVYPGLDEYIERPMDAWENQEAERRIARTRGMAFRREFEAQFTA